MLASAWFRNDGSYAARAHAAIVYAVIYSGAHPELPRQASLEMAMSICRQHGVAATLYDPITGRRCWSVNCVGSAVVP